MSVKLISIAFATASDYGLLDDTARIDTREGWERRLADRGFIVRGHRLIRQREDQAEEGEPPKLTKDTKRSDARSRGLSRLWGSSQT